MMPSEKKKRKLLNSYGYKTWLKNKTIKIKRVGFYTSSYRRMINNIKED